MGFMWGSAGKALPGSGHGQLASNDANESNDSSAQRNSVFARSNDLLSSSWGIKSCTTTIYSRHSSHSCDSAAG